MAILKKNLSISWELEWMLPENPGSFLLLCPRHPHFVAGKSSNVPLREPILFLLSSQPTSSTTILNSQRHPEWLQTRLWYHHLRDVLPFLSATLTLSTKPFLSLLKNALDPVPEAPYPPVLLTECGELMTLRCVGRDPGYPMGALPPSAHRKGVWKASMMGNSARQTVLNCLVKH